jgi:hypothetical protein
MSNIFLMGTAVARILYVSVLVAIPAVMATRTLAMMRFHPNVMAGSTVGTFCVA